MSERGSGILANTAYRAIADLVSKFGSVFLFIVMARRLGDEAFGVFTFALAFVTLVTALADFGQDATLTREVSRERSRVDRYFANTLALKLLLAAPALAIALAAGAAIGFREETIAVALLLGIGVVVDQLTSTCFGVFQAHERLVYLPISLVSQRLFTAAVGIIALLAGADVVAVAGAYLLGSLVGLIIALWCLVKRVVRPRLAVDRSMWWPLMRAAAPIGLAAVFGAVLARVDTAMLAAYRSSDVVGHYGAAYRLYETTFFLSWGVGAAVYPVFSRMAVESPGRSAAIFERSLKLLIALTLPLALGSVILGPGVVRLLFGDEYESAGPALQLLGPAIAFFPIAYVASYLLVANDRQRTMTAIFGVVALENVVVNLILIPSMSLRGAALGNSISEALAAGLLLAFALPLVGRIGWWRSLSSPAVATVLAAVAMFLLRDWTLPAVAAGAAVYVLVLLSLEQIVFPEDARALWTLFRPAGRTG